MNRSSEGPNATLVREVIAAWNEDDWDRIEESTSATAVMNAPEGWPESGRFEGWPAVRAQYERLKDSWGEEQIEIVELMEHGHKVLARNRWTGKAAASGLDLDLEVWVVYEIDAGRIVSTDFTFDETRARTLVGR